MRKRFCNLKASPRSAATAYDRPLAAFALLRLPPVHFVAAMLGLLVEQAAWSQPAASAPQEQLATASLRDPKLTQEQRDAAAVKLAESPEGITALLAALTDADPPVRFAAASGLMAIRSGTSDVQVSPAIVAAMAPLQTNADAGVRMKALSWMSNGNRGRAPAAALATALADSDPLIRRQSMHMCGENQMARAEVVLPLATAVAIEKDPETRLNGMRSLSQFSAHEPDQASAIRQAAMEQMQSAQPAERVAGVLAASVIQQPDIDLLALISKLLIDPERLVVNEAAAFASRRLGRLPADPAAIDLAVSAIASGNDDLATVWVSNSAATLTHWLPPLKEHFARAEGEPKRRLGIVLAALGEVSAASTEDLIADLGSPSAARRKIALKALLAPGRDAAAVEPALGQLSNTDPAIRREATDALYARFGPILQPGTAADRTAEEKWRPQVYGTRGAARVEVFRQMGEAGVAAGPAIQWLIEPVVGDGFTPEERAAAAEALMKIFRSAAAVK